MSSSELISAFKQECYPDCFIQQVQDKYQVIQHLAGAWHTSDQFEKDAIVVDIYLEVTGHSFRAIPGLRAELASFRSHLQSRILLHSKSIELFSAHVNIPLPVIQCFMRHPVWPDSNFMAKIEKALTQPPIWS